MTHIAIPDNSVNNLTNGTIEAWVYLDSNAEETIIAKQSDSENSYAIFTIGYYSDSSGVPTAGDAGRLYFHSKNSVTQAESSSTVSTGVWTHVAVTFNSSGATFYIDGVNSGTTAGDFSIPDDTTVTTTRIGSWGGSAGGRFLDGRLDEIRVWKDLRTVVEIRDHMFQSLIGNESNLIAYYRFDQEDASDQTILYDLTSNSLNGTLTDMDPTTNWGTSSAFNTWIGSEDQSWSTSGNWSLYSAPGSTDNVGIFNYTNALTSTIGATGNMNNLVVGTGSRLEDPGAYLAGTAERFFNHGIVQQTKDVTSGLAVNFISTGGYGGLTIDALDELGNTTVTIKGRQDCTTVPGETVYRCFDISSTNPPASGATLTFYFDAEELGNNTCDANTRVYHWNELMLDWDEITPTAFDCASTPQSMTIGGITSFSAFVVKSPAAPTALTLTSFTGRARTSLLLLTLLLIISAGALLYSRRANALSR